MYKKGSKNWTFARDYAW